MTSLIAERIREVLTLDPSSGAIQFEDRVHPWSYISTVVENLDRCLDHVDSGPGCAVGLIMRNRPPHAAVLAASIITERCVVTLSPMFSDEALANDIRALALHAIAGERGDLERPGIMEAAIEAGVTVLLISEDDDDPVRTILEGTAVHRSRSRPGVVLEMLSSGTTGVPKRIPLTYDSLQSSLQGDDAHLKAGDASARLQVRPALVWHPIVHISGAYFVIDALYSGRRIIFLERFEPRAWARIVEREGVRVGHLNPTAMRMLLEEEIPPEQLASLKVVRGGTGATPPELQIAFEERFHVPVLTTYGATEFAGAVAGWTLDDHRVYGRSHVGASGRAHEGVALRTVNVEFGDVLGVGEEGVLEVRANQTSADASTWVRTTDLAVIDEQGFLWVKGRIDDAIIRGGFKIHPAKVEAALEEHPDVREAAVVGLLDERLGAVPVAAVTLLEGARDVDPATLLAFVRSRLSAYEVPRDQECGRCSPRRSTRAQA
jgi:acyl-CoA synthetase (AMP-forming)/AMP-acid ligase II